MGGPGRFGANLFFLLSGFLVTTLLVREAAKKGTVAVARFRARRARRLYPLYFTVLAAYTALVALVEPAGVARDAFFANLPAFATFTSNLSVDLDGEHVIFYFAWSLAAQEQFYLWWPLYVKHLDLRARVGALVSLLATVYLTRAGVFDLALPEGTWLRTVALSVMPALLLGALIALALNARASFDALRRMLGARWVSVALLLAALVLWRSPRSPEPLIHATLALLTIACVVREDHVLARLLTRPALVHVGTVSYGIYLLHMLCHNAVERGLARAGSGAGVLDFVLTAALAIGVATVSHRYFERRFLPAEKRAKLA
jgi:peptidoglycan/LPS O-acetylase OafA/YrhL